MKISVKLPQKFLSILNFSDKKDKCFKQSFTVIDCSKKQTIIDVRFYETANKHYCCVWADSFSCSGNVSGYQHYSWAFLKAINNAGIVVENFGISLETTLKLIAVKLGVNENNIMVIHSHP